MLAGKATTLIYEYIHTCFLEVTNLDQKVAK